LDNIPLLKRDLIFFEEAMDKEQFINLRKRLEKTQKEMAQLLGTSLKAIHSYEQGWRSVPVHAERQILFLFSRRRENKQRLRDCWKAKKCPTDLKRRCPAWEFQAGKFCWHINGTICEGTVQKNWNEKMKICRKCEIFTSLLHI